MNQNGDSGSQTSSGDTGPRGSFKSWSSALFLDDDNQNFLGNFNESGRVAGTAVYLVWSAKPDVDPWTGISISFCLVEAMTMMDLAYGIGVGFHASLKRNGISNEL